MCALCAGSELMYHISLLHCYDCILFRKKPHLICRPIIPVMRGIKVLRLFILNDLVKILVGCIRWGIYIIPATVNFILFTIKLNYIPSMRSLLRKRSGFAVSIACYICRFDTRLLQQILKSLRISATDGPVL